VPVVIEQGDLIFGFRRADELIQIQIPLPPVTKGNPFRIPSNTCICSLMTDDEIAKEWSGGDRTDHRKEGKCLSWLVETKAFVIFSINPN
jgi:hypothetical protein